MDGEATRFVASNGRNSGQRRSDHRPSGGRYRFNEAVRSLSLCDYRAERDSDCKVTTFFSYTQTFLRKKTKNLHFSQKFPLFRLFIHIHPKPLSIILRIIPTHALFHQKFPQTPAFLDIPTPIIGTWAYLLRTVVDICSNTLRSGSPLRYRSLVPPLCFVHYVRYYRTSLPHPHPPFPKRAHPHPKTPFSHLKYTFSKKTSQNIWSCQKKALPLQRI